MSKDWLQCIRCHETLINVIHVCRLKFAQTKAPLFMVSDHLCSCGPMVKMGYNLK